MKYYTLKLEFLKDTIDDYGTLFQYTIEDYPLFDSMEDVILHLLKKSRLEMNDHDKESLNKIIILHVWHLLHNENSRDIYGTFSAIVRRDYSDINYNQEILDKQFRVPEDKLLESLRELTGQNNLTLSMYLEFLEEVEPIITVQLPVSDWNLLNQVISEYLSETEYDMNKTVTGLKNRIQNQIEDNPLNK